MIAIRSLFSHILFGVALFVVPGHPGLAADKSIILASTTSVESSGLLANILPQFTAKTGITVNVVAQGTGKALDTARRGDADLLLVHDPEAEQQFMDEGHGSVRRQIAWNDFIIVGPSADPARVRGGNDSVAAFKTIAAAQAPFVSRGDKSGTNAAELRLWKSAGQTPDALAKEKWYREIGGGMGQALNAASAMNAYTLSDRGTWLSFNNKGSLIVAIEGDTRLLNRYDVIELNPQKHANAKLETARVFADWLVSPEGQQAIGAYQANGEKLFNPSAAAPR
jgi:tungstate transport system substrate-binding protein